MTIVLTYTIANDTQEQVEFKSDITKIDLSNCKITNIDLSSLSECTNLREIDLHDNQLQTIDLSPLSACKELSVLNLGNNQLQSIDLTPLRSCPNLEKLFLYWNYLKKETVIPIFTEIRKGDTKQNVKVEFTYIVPVDSTTLKMVVSTTARIVDFSGLAHCKHLEEIIIRQCENVESIDLTPLNNSSTLLVIRIDENGPFKQLIMPSGCENLEGIVITGNGFRPPKREYEEKVVIVGRPTQNLKIDGFEILPTKPYQITAGWPIITIDGAPSIQKPQPISFSEMKARRVETKPCIVDLSVLDGSPNLRVITMKNNYLSVILPAMCSNLEAVILENTMIKEWRLEECPAIRFVKLNHRGNDFDFGHFLEQFESSRHRPIIFINYDFDEAGTGYGVVGFYEFPQKIKEFFVSSHKDKRWSSYLYLDQDYQTDISVRIKQRREYELAEKKRKLERESTTLDQISKCSNISDLRKLLDDAKHYVRNADEVVNILETLLSNTSPPLNRELAFVVLSHPYFNEYFRGRLSWSMLGIIEEESEPKDYVKLLGNSLISPPEKTPERERIEYSSRLELVCIEILNRLFENYEDYDSESIINEITNLLEVTEEVDLQTILLLSIVTLHKVYGNTITRWLSHEGMLDTFSRFLSENLLDFYYMNEQLSRDFKEREVLGSFFDSIVMNPRIVKGIASFIITHELSAEVLYYDILRNITSAQSLMKEDEIANALLKHTSIIIDMIRSEGELFGRGSETWCWHVIRLIDKIPSLIENEEIQKAISEQIKFIAGCMIFGSPEDYPLPWLLDAIVETKSLLRFVDIQNALCFCLRFQTYFAGQIESRTVSKLASDHKALKIPLLREALQSFLEIGNYDIVLPSKNYREYSSPEIRKISKNIKEARYPLAAVMTAYFDQKAWKHDSVRESSKSRFDDIAAELESGHHEKYEWWDYFHNYYYTWYFCQADILFERDDIVSLLNSEKSRIARNLRLFEEPPNESMGKALAAIGLFWSEYDMDYHEMTKQDAEYEKRRLQRKADQRTGTLYNLVKLWTHPKHPWTPMLFLEILDEFKGSFNREDRYWNFLGEFPTGTDYDWSSKRTMKVSEEEQRKSLVRLLEEYEYDLKHIRLSKETATYYIQSRRLIMELVDDDSQENAYEPDQ